MPHSRQVISGVSSQTIARTQDRDVGKVVRRIPPQSRSPVGDLFRFGCEHIDWTSGYSYANRHLPDLQLINRQENDIYGDVHYDKMRIAQNDMQRAFTQSVEHLTSAGVNYERNFRKGKRCELRLSAKDLLGDDVELCQFPVFTDRLYRRRRPKSRQRLEARTVRLCWL